MINFTERLDKAIRISAWAHEQAGQHRKGTDIPYIIHPFGVMVIASNATDDEDVLIACLLHDVLEDVEDSIYSIDDMLRDFGERVVGIVKDVTKDPSLRDWHEVSRAYLNHLEHQASDQAVIVSAADKIHNILSVHTDFDAHGDQLWERFSTKSAGDQLWWYSEISTCVAKRKAPQILCDQLSKQVRLLRAKLGSDT